MTQWHNKSQTGDIYDKVTKKKYSGSFLSRMNQNIIEKYIQLPLPMAPPPDHMQWIPYDRNH